MSVTVMGETRPKARRPHKCHGCLGVIAKGDLHVAVACAHDGQAFTARWCLRCDGLLDKLIAEGVFDNGQELDEGCLVEFIEGK